MTPDALELLHRMPFVGTHRSDDGVVKAMFLARIPSGGLVSDEAIILYRTKIGVFYSSETKFHQRYVELPEPEPAPKPPYRRNIEL